MTFWKKGKNSKKPMPSALPVFSVDTEEEAKAVQTRFCKLSYDGKRMVWNNFPVHDYEYLGTVSDQMREFYETMKSREDRKRGDTRIPAND